MIDWLFNPLAKLKPSKSREPDDIRMLWSLDVGHATMQRHQISQFRESRDRWTVWPTWQREEKVPPVSRGRRQKSSRTPQLASRLRPRALGGETESRNFFTAGRHTVRVRSNDSLTPGPRTFNRTHEPYNYFVVEPPKKSGPRAPINVSTDLW